LAFSISSRIFFSSSVAFPRASLTAGITVKFRGSKTGVAGTYEDITSATATLIQSQSTVRAWAPIDFDKVGYIQAVYWATNALNVDSTTTTLVGTCDHSYHSYSTLDEQDKNFARNFRSTKKDDALSRPRRRGYQ
jgi:hypothetical protein